MQKRDNATPYSASTYDSHVRQTIPYYDYFHQETINLIKAMHHVPKRWLDTGCGTGTLVQKAAAEFPDTQFVLADPSAQMLQTAKQKLAKTPNITFLEPAPTEKLSLPKASFDIITAIQSHHYLHPSEHAQATSICYDLLVPNGVYVSFENIRPLTQRGIEIAKENWKRFQIASGRDPEAVEGHLKRFGVDYHPLTVEEHLSELRVAGFSVVELLWYAVMQAGFYCVK